MSTGGAGNEPVNFVPQTKELALLLVNQGPGDDSWNSWPSDWFFQSEGPWEELQVVVYLRQEGSRRSLKVVARSQEVVDCLYGMSRTRGRFFPYADPRAAAGAGLVYEEINPPTYEKAMVIAEQIRILLFRD